MGYSSDYSNASAEEFKNLMCREHILIDVRDEEEFDNGHVLNAVNIPLDEISDYIDTIKLQNKSKLILLYCSTGARSATGAKMLSQLGCEDLYILSGGYKTWSNKFGN